MRAFKLLLIGLLTFLIAFLWLFPVGPIVDRVRPQLPEEVQLVGVDGRMLNGRINQVRYTDPLLPLEFQEVGWRIKPSSAFSGGAAEIDFKGYGGSGSGEVSRHWNGDIAVNDLVMTAEARELEVLLPAPVASFRGPMEVDISTLLLDKNQMLKELNGAIYWYDAVFERPLAARLGTVEIVIRPEGPNTHLATVSASGGDVNMEGEIRLSQNGDFQTNVLLTPTPSATPELKGYLGRIAVPDASGRVRWAEQGNINRL